MTKTSGESEVLTLGGRAFRPIGVTTVEHDHFFWKAARDAGLAEIELREGEGADDFAQRLLASLLGSGAAMLLVGCALVPCDRPGRWSPDMARDTAAFVGGLTEPRDKAVLSSILVSVVVGFFVQGLTSLWSSRTSSALTPEQMEAEGISPTSAANGGASGRT